MDMSGLDLKRKRIREELWQPVGWAERREAQQYIWREALLKSPLSHPGNHIEVFARSISVNLIHSFHRDLDCVTHALFEPADDEGPGGQGCRSFALNGSCLLST